MALAIRFHDQLSQTNTTSLRDETLRGFAATPKWASPKFFYDRRGSELFEQITEQPEYYPTRTEIAILAQAASEIAEIAGPDADLIEFGSGASRKVRLLLEAMRPTSYLGIDISDDFLRSSTQRLAADYPWLDVHALCADFCDQLYLPKGLDSRCPLAFFPGSSIGNFTPAQAQQFLRRLHSLLPVGGGLLVGVDLVKDKAVLEAAYNDAAGVTAAFNLNLLERIRYELDSDIDPAHFTHKVIFNAAQSRIEMHLVSREAQTVTIEGRRFQFKAGETLHTENSYKYSLESFAALARSARFDSVRQWTDPQRLFSVHYLKRTA
ncbi:L-histidine N(alpha)-methyltransferase [Stutzerimonas zhaodongensis]|jgi:dimethylhistidine N-methyltransferase|uniref:L-histidine N(Alpha)-methyltransferase n=1 Tax=Stutzerimonas zhaodongensis TaxID=1176257 RepID=A0A365PZ77_9GAMM|nr:MULTISPECIES: L-histidine N(alpha)-methyltransferase [Pseudomonadaceae]NKQ12094.1 L-histidine N(alpha)-methyltransferase [Pseudomonas sp. SST3]RBA62240.1 L-histidine N(alpha)-methyltransferase [Stutzerimonas zhaodongensis]